MNQTHKENEQSIALGHVVQPPLGGFGNYFGG